MGHPYAILLAEDHGLFRREIKKIVAEIPGLKLTGEAKDGLDLFKLLEIRTPDLVILDISMPHLKGMEATQIIKMNYPGVKVLLMILDKEKEYLVHAISAGADGVILKQEAATQLPQAIDKIRRGRTYLPPPWEGNRTSPRKTAWGERDFEQNF